MDKGIKRKSRHDSEADWLRRRRLAVKEATPRDHPGETDGTLIMDIDDDGTVQSQGTITADNENTRPAQWCEQHEKELHYQMDKKLSRQVEALRDGVLSNKRKHLTFNRDGHAAPRFGLALVETQ